MIIQTLSGYQSIIVPNIIINILEMFILSLILFKLLDLKYISRDAKNTGINFIISIAMGLVNATIASVFEIALEINKSKTIFDISIGEHKNIVILICKIFLYITMYIYTRHITKKIGLKVIDSVRYTVLINIVNAVTQVLTFMFVDYFMGLTDGSRGLVAMVASTVLIIAFCLSPPTTRVVNYIKNHIWTQGFLIVLTIVVIILTHNELNTLNGYFGVLLFLFIVFMITIGIKLHDDNREEFLKKSGELENEESIRKLTRRVEQLKKKEDKEVREGEKEELKKEEQFKKEKRN